MSWIPPSFTSLPPNTMKEEGREEGREVHYELYRRSTLGMTLTDALDEMVTNGELTPSIAMKVLAQFDKCMNDALKDVKTKTTFKGNLDTYRFCDNVWTFLLDDVTFTMTGPGGFKDTAHVEKLKIVACDGKVTGGAPKEVGSAPVEGS